MVKAAPMTRPSVTNHGTRERALDILCSPARGLCFRFNGRESYANPPKTAPGLVTLAPEGGHYGCHGVHKMPSMVNVVDQRCPPRSAISRSAGLLTKP